MRLSVVTLPMLADVKTTQARSTKKFFGSCLRNCKKKMLFRSVFLLTCSVFWTKFTLILLSLFFCSVSVIGDTVSGKSGKSLGNLVNLKKVKHFLLLLRGDKVFCWFLGGDRVFSSI